LCIFVVILRPHIMKRDVIPILRAKHICVHSFLVFVIVAIIR